MYYEVVVNTYRHLALGYLTNVLAEGVPDKVWHRLIRK